MKALRFRLLAGLVASCGISLVAQAPEMPHLRKQGSATQLVVDGRPFLVRGGELGNSSASNLEYLAPHWDRFRVLGLNTILAPVSWDLLEPDEGRFDFTLVDGLVTGARAHDLRLVLLGFGSWKNSMSCYAPAWVKKDQRRFPRASDASGTSVEILSPFSEAAAGADARAFGALMKHLRAIDGDRHTVLMIQVENEIVLVTASPRCVYWSSVGSMIPGIAWPTARYWLMSARVPCSICCTMSGTPSGRPRSTKRFAWSTVVWSRAMPNASRARARVSTTADWLCVRRGAINEGPALPKEWPALIPDPRSPIPARS
jgi:hypothetical protein